MSYDNTNSGALFKNAKKKTDKHPDYTGKLDVEGTEYWLSAWLKTSKAGEKYMSLSVTDKSKSTMKQADPDDNIPF